MANPRCYKCEVTSYYLACSFLPQRLFLPSGFIPGLLFSSAGMISSFRIHLWLALLFRRDDFFLPDSSLACSFVLQGLFLPPGFIPGVLFCSAGIISSTRIHPQRALFFHRDYFVRPDASLACSFLPQGLLLPSGFIPGVLFCSAGIISSGQIHPQRALFLHRDYLFRSDSSLACSFSPQG